MELKIATDEEFKAAKDVAEDFMINGDGNRLYSSSKQTAMYAIIDYILYTQGKKVKRT